MAVKEDIDLAIQIAGNKGYEHETFNDHSFIYKSTNETISDPHYIELLRDNRRTLSIIGSGDQILNSILMGSYKIDAYDISRFPKYFLELKLAAIRELSYEEYLGFFYGYMSDDDIFNKKTYRLLVDSLEGDAKKFWKAIASTRVFSRGMAPREVYDSKLFMDTSYPVRDVREYNPYLSKGNYNELKKRLANASIHYITGNILDFGTRLEDNYDFINLSNIIAYQAEMHMEEQYQNPNSRMKSFIKNLRLNPDGRVLNYIFSYHPGSKVCEFVDKQFRFDPDYRIHMIYNHNTKCMNDAVVVYHKSK